MKSLVSVFKIIKRMSVFDVSVYKFTLFSFGFLLALFVPWFTSINPIIWLGIAIVLLLYVSYYTYKSRKKPKNIFKTVMKNFHEFKLPQLAAFEIGMTALALAIFHYIPWFSTVNPMRYLAIFFFGMGWILSMYGHPRG